jgi:uncharacterized protein YceK
MRLLLLGFAALILAATSGCATIISGTEQTVSVEARHAGTVMPDCECMLENNKGSWSVVPPATVVVARSFSDLVVTCTNKTMDAVKVVVKSVTGLATLGNIVMIGGLIGAAIDFDNGSAFDYPSLITVNFGLAQAPEIPTETGASK